MVIARVTSCPSSKTYGWSALKVCRSTSSISCTKISINASEVYYFYVEITPTQRQRNRLMGSTRRNKLWFDITGTRSMSVIQNEWIPIPFSALEAIRACVILGILSCVHSRWLRCRQSEFISHHCVCARRIVRVELRKSIWRLCVGGPWQHYRSHDKF